MGMPDRLEAFEVRLAEALRSRASRAPGPRDPQLVAVRAMSAKQAKQSISMPLVVGGVALIVVLVVGSRLFGSIEGAIGSAPPQSIPPQTAATLSLGDFTIDVPDGWQLYQRSRAHGSGWGLVGYLSTVPVPPPCVQVEAQEQCDLRPYVLPPSSGVLTIISAGRPGHDPLSEASPSARHTTVDGMPAVSDETSPDPDTGADDALVWTIARPRSVTGVYEFAAELRGPNVDELRQKIQTMIESVRWNPSVSQLPSDVDASRAALRNALSSLAAQSASYRCFSTEPGSSEPGEIDGLPAHPPLAEPLAVTCSSEIRPTARQLWETTLTFTWEAVGPRAAGRYVTMAWFAADGEHISTQHGGDSP